MFVNKVLEMLLRWNVQMQEVVNETLERGLREIEEARSAGRSLPSHDEPDAKNFPSRIVMERDAEQGQAALRLETVGGRGLWLFSLKHLVNNTVNARLEHKWTIVTAPPGTRWLTSESRSAA